MRIRTKHPLRTALAATPTDQASVFTPSLSAVASLPAHTMEVPS